MTERDIRWEKVRANISPPEQSAEELEMGISVDDWLVFEFSVKYKGRTFWQYQQVHKDDVELVEIDMYKFILDEMVKAIDDQIAEWSHHRTVVQSHG